MIDAINKYYVGTDAEVDAVEARICLNANLPNGRGTVGWSDKKVTSSGDTARIVPINGWNGFTYEQMIAGVTHPESSNVEFPDVEV